MATGKAPWSQQYQEVAALFYVGTTKSHPPIPEHLSNEAKDFLLKCSQKEPDLRPSASELLKHPFVTGERGECQFIIHHSAVRDGSGKRMADHGVEINKLMKLDAKRSCNGLKDAGELGSSRCSPIHAEQLSGRSIWPVNFDDDDMCRVDDDDLARGPSMEFMSTMVSGDRNQINNFNLMSDLNDDWQCKLDEHSKSNKRITGLLPNQSIDSGKVFISSDDVGFTFPVEQSVAGDDGEAAESKIKEFLDEMVLEMKKLQTPLYEFYNSSSVSCSMNPADNGNNKNVSNNCNLPPKSKSSSRVACRRLSTDIDAEHSTRRACYWRRASNIGDVNLQAPHGVNNSHQVPCAPSFTGKYDIQRKWEEELHAELERNRELIRQAGGAAKASSPKDRVLDRHRDRIRFASPWK